MATSWDVKGLSQLDFMAKDECIVLDDKDNIIGHANKYDTHVFDTKRPQGTLHRAFSVFLFDQKGRLLLQQRAKSKITFPSVWTNTCCSHPLNGFTPTEVDTPANVASGETPGVKRAAIRKLEHELGIKDDPNDSMFSKFKFLTRLHYWASDTITHGPSSEWGEHEIDYLLFIQATVDVVPNLEEVDDFKYVTMDELKTMMDPSNGLLWSPWFRIICEKFLYNWWGDLDNALHTDKYVDKETIFTFGPPFPGLGYQHQGCYKPKASLADKPVTKQGSYGKIVTHSESKISQLLRFDEVFNAVLFKLHSPLKNQLNPLQFGEALKEEVLFCDKMLGKVSRSFAAVIRQLPPNLVLDIMVFYLVLRGLDTIEDDMESFNSQDEKLFYLNDFATTALHNDKWKMQGVGEGDEALLLENFFKVSKVFQALPIGSQNVIDDITKRMAAGMAKFVSMELGQGTKNTEEYNLYCHYVAGLVGEGLSRIFVATGYEQPIISTDCQTSNSMGLFLQKTNIIRDYLEDYVDHRAWWPQDVWKKYSKDGDLGWFAKPEGKEDALKCLNELVCDALTLIPESLIYMRRLENPDVFRFCAIPQVMAVATLAKCFNNPDVFTGVVKLRKGLAVKMIVDSNSMAGVEYWFRTCVTEIKSKVNPSDPSAHETIKACDLCLDLTTDRTSLIQRLTPKFLPPISMLFIAYSTYYKPISSLSLWNACSLLFKGKLDINTGSFLIGNLAASGFLLVHSLNMIFNKNISSGFGKLKSQ
jgi:farnesyl-diphosphate farnesyltransferase